MSLVGHGGEWKRLGTFQEAVVKVVGDHYGLYGRVLSLDLELENDLGSDRLDKLEVLMTIEELFGFYFDPSISDDAVTIRDVIDAVRVALSDTGELSENDK